MRSSMKSLVVTVTAATIIATTGTIAEARPARTAPRPQPRTDIVQTVRNFVSTIGGIFALSVPTIPRPAPEPKSDNSTSGSYAIDGAQLPSGGN